MKRSNRTILAVLMVGFLVSPVLAQPNLNLVWSRQCDRATEKLIVTGDTVECWQESQPPEPTETPTATVTAEPGSTVTPTATVTITATATPTATVTPEPVTMCPHDMTKYHDLYDEEHHCAYNHEHGEDPNDPAVVAIFGAPGAWYGHPGTEIGGPFAMTSEMGPGHVYWKWSVKLNIPPSMTEASDSGAYIKNLRVLMHVADGGPPVPPAGGGLLNRYHGFSIEAQVCMPQEQGKVGVPITEECGISRWAGVGDFGNLRTNDQPDGLILLPHQGDGQDVDLGQQGKRFHVSYDALQAGDWPGVNWYMRTWCASDQDTQFSCTSLASIVADPWVYVVPVEGGAQVGFICGDSWATCGYNGSQRELHIAASLVNARWFTTTPINLQVVVGQHGDPDAMCTTMGQTMCGYASLEGYPVTGYMRFANHGADVREYDTSPPGQNWIGFPN